MGRVAFGKREEGECCVDESVYITDLDTGHTQGRKYKEIQGTRKQTHWKPVDQSQHNLFRFRRAAFYSPRKSKVATSSSRPQPPRIHWVEWGTGTPKDRDEINRREV